MSTSRHLAAVMFTDISGYTALMGESESKALALLERNKHLQEPIINKHDGKIVKELGDGLLAVFDSALEAVACAVEIQQESRAIPELNLKIGIHLGDINFTDNDVFGDGVNMASRLQQEADPGQILVTPSIKETIYNQDDFTTNFVKVAHLKNVAEPVKLYEIKQFDGDTEISAEPDPVLKKLKWFVLVALLALLSFMGYQYLPDWVGTAEGRAPEKVRIAVLPIRDLSEKGDQQFFADGIMEDLISNFHKLKIYVTPRTSVLQYRDGQTSIRKIGRDLRVDYVIESTLRKTDEEILLTTQIIETENEEILDIKEFKQNYSMGGLTTIQKDLADQVVTQLRIKVIPEDLFNSFNPGTQNIAAYELVKKGWSYYSKHDIENYKVAIDFGKSALGIDSSYVDAYGLLSNAYGQLANQEESINWRDSVRAVAFKGLELDSLCTFCYAGLAKYNQNAKETAFYYDKAFSTDSTNLMVLFNYIDQVFQDNPYINNRWETAYKIIDARLKYYPLDEFKVVPDLVRLHFFTGHIDLAREYLEPISNGGASTAWSALKLFHIAYDIGNPALGETLLNQRCGIFFFPKDEEWCKLGYYIKLEKLFYERRYSEIVEFIRTVGPVPGVNWRDQWMVNYAFYKSGFIAELDLPTTRELEAKFDTLGAISRFDYGDYTHQAIYEQNFDKAFDGLEKAIEADYLIDIREDVFLEELRNYSRFNELADRQKTKREELAQLIASKNYPSPKKLMLPWQGTWYYDNSWQTTIKLSDDMLKESPEFKWVAITKWIGPLYYQSGDEKTALKYLQAWKKALELGIHLWFYPKNLLIEAANYLEQDELLVKAISDIRCEDIDNCNADFLKNLHFVLSSRKFSELVLLDQDNKDQHTLLTDWEYLRLMYAYWKSGLTEELNRLWIERFHKNYHYLNHGHYDNNIKSIVLSIMVDELDYAYDLLTKAVEDGYLIDISKNKFFEELYDRPGFNELVQIQSENRERVAALIAEKDFPSAYELATTHEDPDRRLPEGSIPK